MQGKLIERKETYEFRDYIVEKTWDGTGVQDVKVFLTERAFEVNGHEADFILQEFNKVYEKGDIQF